MEKESRVRFNLNLDEESKSPQGSGIRPFARSKSSTFFSDRKTLAPEAVKSEMQTVQTSFGIDQQHALVREVLAHLELYLNLKQKIDEKNNCLVLDTDGLYQLRRLQVSQELAKALHTLIDDFIQNLCTKHLIPAYEKVKSISAQKAEVIITAITEATLNEFRMAGLQKDKNISDANLTLDFSKLHDDLKKHIDANSYAADLKKFKALLEDAQKKKQDRDHRLDELKTTNFSELESNFVSQQQLSEKFYSHLVKKYLPQKLQIDEEKLKEIVADSVNFLINFSNFSSNTNPLLKGLSLKENSLVYFNGFNEKNLADFFDHLDSQLKLVTVKKTGLSFEYKKNKEKLENAIKNWADKQWQQFRPIPRYVKAAQAKPRPVSENVLSSKKRLNELVGVNVYRESVKPQEKVAFEENSAELRNFLKEGKKLAEFEMKVLKYESEYEGLKKQINEISNCVVISMEKLNSLHDLEKQKAFCLTMQTALHTFVKTVWKNNFSEVCKLYRKTKHKDYVFVIDFIAQAIIDEFAVVDVADKGSNKPSEKGGLPLDFDNLLNILQKSIVTDKAEDINKENYLNFLRNFRGLLQQALNQKLFNRSSLEPVPHSEYKRQFQYLDEKHFVDYKKQFIAEDQFLAKLIEQDFTKGIKFAVTPMVEMIKQTLWEFSSEQKFSKLLAFKVKDQLFFQEKYLQGLFEQLDLQFKSGGNKLSLKDVIKNALHTWLTFQLDLSKEAMPLVADSSHFGRVYNP